MRPLAAHLGGTVFVLRRFACAGTQPFDSLAELVADSFGSYRAHVFICAAGIAMRCLAPCLDDKAGKGKLGNKESDPAVLVCDQHGRNIVSLLSGHLGGANELARKLALLTGGTAVITSATDCEGLPSLDLMAREAGCHIADIAEIAPMNAALLEKRRIRLFDPWHFLTAAPDCFDRLARLEDLAPNEPHVLVDWRSHDPAPMRLRLVPPLLQAALGCRRGVSALDLQTALREALHAAGAHGAALAGLASATLKQEESALHICAQSCGLALRFFDASALQAVPVPNPSPKAGRALGCGPVSVCEAAALLAAGWPEAELVLPKQKSRGSITVALALPLLPDTQAGQTGQFLRLTPVTRPVRLAGNAQNMQNTDETGISGISGMPGMPGGADVSEVCGAFATDRAGNTAATLHLVGLGPGDVSAMSGQALAVLGQARVIAGYSLYMDMVPPVLLAGKECISTGMRGEVERCNAAIDAACSGKTTAVVCSGDAGIYGMAGLVLELLEQRGLDSSVPFELVPGIPAFCAAAALLGAPLMHDFACVSLSDLLTPWDLILRRLEAALKGDFVLVLYNPRSRGRDWQLGAALDLARSLRPGTTPVGLVRQACRQGQSVGIHELAQLDAAQVDMLSLLIIGNSSTRRVGNRMLTPRGYFT